MSMGDFFRSLSQKVSKSIEEIKIKSNEASSDIKRSMREIRDSTKEGVEKIGVALKLSDTDAALYSDVDETAGMKLAAHYSHALAAIRENNRNLIERGDKTSVALSRVQQQTNREHDSVSALIKQCENLPEILSSVDVLKARTDTMLENLTKIESLLGDTWEETVVSQISVWKLSQESELDDYRLQKAKELEKIEKELQKSKLSKTEERRTKALAKTAEYESAESQANQQLISQLDASIKKGMDEYLIYGFTAKSKPALESSSSDAERQASDEALKSIQITSPTEELDDFLGEKDLAPKPALAEEEDDTNAVKVDTTTIDTPEV